MRQKDGSVTRGPPADGRAPRAGLARRAQRVQILAGDAAGIGTFPGKGFGAQRHSAQARPLPDEQGAQMELHAAIGAGLLAGGESELIRRAERIAGGTL